MFLHSRQNLTFKKQKALIPEWIKCNISIYYCKFLRINLLWLFILLIIGLLCNIFVLLFNFPSQMIIPQTSPKITIDGIYTDTRFSKFCGSITSLITLTFNIRFCSRSGFIDCHYKFNTLETRTRKTNLKLKSQIRCLISGQPLIFLSIFLSLSVTLIFFL